MAFTVRISCQKSCLKFTRKVKGHIMTLIEVGMHLITCLYALMCNERKFCRTRFKTVL